MIPGQLNDDECELLAQDTKYRVLSEAAKASGNAGKETMAAKNLTADQWNQLFALPADGNSYNVPGVSFRAIHKPQTRMHVEQVVAETAFGTLRRRLVSGRWQAVEYLGGSAS